MDTTYFGRKFGVMVFKDSITGTILWKQYVQQETNQLYVQGIEKIIQKGLKIQAIICDGRKGVLQQFKTSIPVQMCVFHQVAIVRRYWTINHKTEASKEFWQHTLSLKKSDRESFAEGLDGSRSGSCF